ncbi:MAG: hypothetical protein ACTHMS_02190 [Jatrophihabitans sp.]|uniref:hypothetical protein n=1 Tax=Jatrophihabitans sp. TaxID=1932789 RepID=UPI003F809612
MDAKSLLLAVLLSGAVIGGAATAMASSGSSPSGAPSSARPSGVPSDAPPPWAHGHRGGRPGGPFGAGPLGPGRAGGPGLGLGHGSGGPLHGSWVVTDPKGGYVTRDEIRGAVTAVSASSISVRAADGFSATYAVTPTTAILLRPAHGGPDEQPPSGAPSTPATRPSTPPAPPQRPGHPPTRGSIADVHKGDQVVVLGTGTSTLTAMTIATMPSR